MDDASDDTADNIADMKASTGETPRADGTTDNASDDALDDNTTTMTGMSEETVCIHIYQAVAVQILTLLATETN